MRLEWIRAEEVETGDRVRLVEGPMVSSHAHWLHDNSAHRANAEASAAPFRVVTRIGPTASASIVQVECVGTDAPVYHLLPRKSGVLVQRSTS